MTKLRVTGLAQACGWRVEDVVQLQEKTESIQLLQREKNIYFLNISAINSEV